MRSNYTERTSTAKNTGKAFFGLLVSTLLTGLIGCVPPKNNTELPVTKITNLSEKAASCEVKLRQQIEAKSLQMQNVSEWDNLIKTANQLVPSTNKSNYYVSLLKNQVQNISAEYTYKTNDTKAEVSYSLSQANKNASAALYLEIRIQSQQSHSKMSVEQRLNVSENCELSINKTTLVKIKKTETDKYGYSEETIYANHEKDKFIANFTLTADQKLIDLTLEADKPTDSLPLMFTYMRGLGVTTIKTQASNKVLMKEFEMDLSLDTFKIELSAKDRIFSTKYAGSDKTLGITLTQNTKGNKWGVPLKLWQSHGLSESKDLNSFVTFQLHANYLKQNNSLQVLSEKNMTYDHMPAYWKVTEIPASTDKKLKAFQLTENAEATILDVSSAADLVSNDTIQTELPEIQTITKAILAEAKDNRREQIHLALKYLSENYPYDKSMLATNSVRPLTTKEALDRGTGVCQHFAVIFTAMTRAMKIPTRIVAGYLLTETSAGMHAWVEVEIAAGTWQVLEPQDPNSLTMMKTRNYIPVSRASTLEDRTNANELLNLIGSFTSQSYIIKAN